MLNVFFFITGVPVDEITPSQKETSGFINYKYKNQIFPSAKNGPEALFKESRYPSQGVIEEFAKLNNLDGATVKVWFNNERQRDTVEQNTNENRPSDA